VRLLLNPVALRAVILMVAAVASFVTGLLLIRWVRRSLVETQDSFTQVPFAGEGLPVHAYHAVIQQMKQQKHELTTQQLSERRKAKASDTLSATILSNLSCGVLFFNTNGLLRQANAAARALLGFASPVGLQASDLFRNATLRPTPEVKTESTTTVEEVLAPALAGTAAVRGVVLNYFTREGENRVLEIAASPVLSEDGSPIGTTIVVNDKTDIERMRHDQKTRQETSSDLSVALRDSLTTIAGYAQQLACSRDAELAHQLADNIAREAAQLDRTIGGFLGGARAATTSS